MEVTDRGESSSSRSPRPCCHSRLRCTAQSPFPSQGVLRTTDEGNKSSPVSRDLRGCWGSAARREGLAGSSSLAASRPQQSRHPYCSCCPAVKTHRCCLPSEDFSASCSPYSLSLSSGRPHNPCPPILQASSPRCPSKAALTLQPPPFQRFTASLLPAHLPQP